MPLYDMVELSSSKGYETYRSCTCLILRQGQYILRKLFKRPSLGFAHHPRQGDNGSGSVRVFEDELHHFSIREDFRERESQLGQVIGRPDFPSIQLEKAEKPYLRDRQLQISSPPSHAAEWRRCSFHHFAHPHKGPQIALYRLRIPGRNPKSRRQRWGGMEGTLRVSRIARKVEDIQFPVRQHRGLIPRAV